MAGQSRKWMILVATIWIQAFTGTNFDFSAYSSELKTVLGVSQVQLNYLATASDLGKLFGWSSGLALMYMPLWVVMFMSAFMGFFAYGLQWLVIRSIITLPYFLVCCSSLCLSSFFYWVFEDGPNSIDCSSICSFFSFSFGLGSSMNSASCWWVVVDALSLSLSSISLYLALRMALPPPPFFFS